MFTCAHDGFVSITIIDSGKCEKKRSRWFTSKIEASPPGPHSAMLKGCFGETRFTKASVCFARAGVSQNCINIESRGSGGSGMMQNCIAGRAFFSHLPVARSCFKMVVETRDARRLHTTLKFRSGFKNTPKCVFRICKNKFVP